MMYSQFILGIMPLLYLHNGSSKVVQNSMIVLISLSFLMSTFFHNKPATYTCLWFFVVLFFSREALKLKIFFFQQLRIKYTICLRIHAQWIWLLFSVSTSTNTHCFDCEVLWSLEILYCRFLTLHTTTLMAKYFLKNIIKKKLTLNKPLLNLDSEALPESQPVLLHFKNVILILHHLVCTKALPIGMNTVSEHIVQVFKFHSDIIKVCWHDWVYLRLQDKT